MEGLSESARINSGVFDTSTSFLPSKLEAPSSTDLVGGSGVGGVGGEGAHSKSRYGFLHLGILVQHMAVRKNWRLAENWRWARVRLS